MLNNNDLERAIWQAAINNLKSINKNQPKYTWQSTTINKIGEKKTELLDNNVFDSKEDAFNTLKEKICTNIFKRKLSGQFYINTDNVTHETSSYKRIYEVVPLPSLIKDNISFSIDFNLKGYTQDEIDDVKAQLSAYLQDFVNDKLSKEYSKNVERTNVEW